VPEGVRGRWKIEKGKWGRRAQDFQPRTLADEHGFEKGSG
jgi:hypothetical protein